MSLFLYSVFLVVIILLLTIILLKYLNHHYDHWKLQGIPTVKGIVPGFGHLLDVILLKKNYVTLLEDMYNTHPNDSMVGFYFLRKPALLVKHPDIVKKVLISEFSSFGDHVPLNSNTDFLLAYHAFFTSGEIWKHTRRVISSSVNIQKLKYLASIFETSSKEILKFVDNKFRDNKSIEVDAKLLYSKFLTHVLSIAIFGIDGRVLLEQESSQSFLAMMNSLFEARAWTATKQNIVLLFPMLGRLIRVNIFPTWASKKFQKIVADSRAFRKTQSEDRVDFLQHAIDYELNYGRTKEDLVPAHAFTFFMEGYETSSLTMATMSCLFAEEPEIQNKAREEVVRVLNKHGGLTYDAIEEMTYLDQCAKETLRLFPALARMQKICTKPITLQGPDGLSCSLKPGDDVFISISGVHKDPAIWSNPDQFNPDRFAEDSEEGRRKYVNLSFGDGPRQCPGIRMSFLQVKAGMAIILKNYSIGSSARMKQRVSAIKIDPLCFLSSAVGGFWVKLEQLRTPLV